VEKRAGRAKAPAAYPRAEYATRITGGSVTECGERQAGRRRDTATKSFITEPCFNDPAEGALGSNRHARRAIDETSSAGATLETDLAGIPLAVESPGTRVPAASGVEGDSWAGGPTAKGIRCGRVQRAGRGAGAKRSGSDSANGGRATAGGGEAGANRGGEAIPASEAEAGEEAAVAVAATGRSALRHQTANAVNCRSQGVVDLAVRWDRTKGERPARGEERSVSPRTDSPSSDETEASTRTIPAAAANARSAAHWAERRRQGEAITVTVIET